MMTIMKYVLVSQIDTSMTIHLISNNDNHNDNYDNQQW